MHMATETGQYLLCFVEEAVFSPKHLNWAGGRMEIHTNNSQYAEEEIRFFTPRTRAWIDFREKYDGEWVDKSTLDKVINAIEQHFHHKYEDS